VDQIAREQDIDRDKIEIWFADEARVGQKNKITRRWALRGTRPIAAQDQCTASTYIFGAICPKEGKGAALVLPHCNTIAMNFHLAEISNAVARRGLTRRCLSTKLDGTSRTSSSCRSTSPSSRCLPNALSSIRSRTSGSTCATIGFCNGPLVNIFPPNPAAGVLLLSVVGSRPPPDGV
jgi:hypothetical protein